MYQTKQSTTKSWRCHQMKTFSALLALCEGKPRVTGGFPLHRPVTQSFDVFFDLHWKKRLSKQSRHQWFEMPSCSLWRNCNVQTVCIILEICVRDLHCGTCTSSISIMAYMDPFGSFTIFTSSADRENWHHGNCWFSVLLYKLTSEMGSRIHYNQSISISSPDIWYPYTGMECQYQLNWLTSKTHDQNTCKHD